MTETKIQFRSDIVVKPIKIAASDAMVIAAARVSTHGERSLEALTKDADEAYGLIRYLAKNRHGTPFEHNMFTFYVEAPIVVYREWHRHRIGFSYNEESGRYKELGPVFYVPARDRMLVQVGKTGHYQFEHGTDEQYERCVDRLRCSYTFAYERYQENLADGIVKEVARLGLGGGLYSSMHVTCNARSIMSFLSLRTNHEDAVFPSKPMHEIAMAANQMEAIFAEAMPLTYRAYLESGRVAP